MVMQNDFETKALGTEIADAFDDFMRAFDAFKTTNDERIAQIERRSAVDTVTEDKLDRLNKALDEQKRTVDALVHRSTRVPLGQGASHASTEHAAAFDAYARRGQEAGLQALETKALSVSTDADGGYLVPSETETVINASLREVSPIRSIAMVRQVTGSVFKKPFAISGAATGWAGETAARPETTTPTLAELSFPTMELYAMPAATQALLDDAVVDIDQWIADEVRAAFAEQEGAAFVTGDGANKPRGFLNYPTVANASWSHGSIGTVATGAIGAFPATNAADTLIDLIYALKSTYRANGSFVMKRSTQAAVRKLKDGDGHYVWQPSTAPGQAPTLMGFPVIEAEDMPDIGTDAPAIAFGDFRRGYLVVDRIGIRVLRDPFSSKPYVLFYTTKRVGGGVQDFDAIKLLVFSA